MFTNRQEVGRKLAEKLHTYTDTDAVVLALPRGGVPVGYEVAKSLHLPLDIVVTRKVGHPLHPEVAVCATEEHGLVLCDQGAIQQIDKNWLQKEIQNQMAEAKRRSTVYRSGRDPLPLTDKTVILVDDGIATGLTMQLAVELIKKQNPKKVVVAVPVASTDAVQRLQELADEVVTLLPPENFLGSVGAHYVAFDQTSDEEVIQALESLHQNNNT
jgi:predicted phosphoribosyltransferase